MLGLGRGPLFEKDSEDLAEALSSIGVKIGLFVLLVLFGGSIVVGIFW